MAEAAPAGPLAARLRPRRLADFVGQRHLVAPGRPLARMAETGRLQSMILWGAPGTGKTTLARLLADATDARLMTLSAVMAGVKDLRAVMATAREALDAGQATVLFIDEIHRFNRAQQDALLPPVEEGTVTFIGATTENPSFEVNAPLLSRARVHRLRPLDDDALIALFERGRERLEVDLGTPLVWHPTARERMIHSADGDGRQLLNLLELAADLAPEQDGARRVDMTVLTEVLAGDVRRFDKGGDTFYEQISALHKALRGSAPDAVLYWYARMLDGGCDAQYIARRAVRMASEDIGNADPRALSIALDAWMTHERLGSPEGDLAVAQALVYLACAPKSDAVYQAFDAAMAQAREAQSLAVPMHLRNAPTGMMNAMGYGADYRHAHDYADGYVPGESYFPPELDATRFYAPTDRGFEQRIRQKLAWLREQDRRSDWRRYGDDARRGR